jgi:hypothetical protein
MTSSAEYSSVSSMRGRWATDPTTKASERTNRHVALWVTTALLLGGMILPGASAYVYVYIDTVAPNPAQQGETVTIHAFTNGSDTHVAEAEYHVDDPNPAPGTGTPMAADDGSFDSSLEPVTGYLDTGNLSAGNHTICVLAREYNPFTNQSSWSTCDQYSMADLVVETNQPPGGNQSPVADAGPDQSGSLGDVFTFNGSDSYDPDGYLVEYYWTFGDGDSAYGVIVTHVYSTMPQNGTQYSACLRVTDNGSAQAWDCASVLIVDPSPAPPRMLPAVLAGAGLADVRLTWELSADDGAGANDVVRYEILAGGVFEGSGSGYGLLATVPAGTGEFVHAGAGAGDPASHFYLLRAVDANGNVGRAADQAGKFARSLGAGDQLVSVPLEQADWSVGTVFQTIPWSRARTYVNPAGQGRNWLSNDRQKPWADLTALHRTMAVWVQLDAPALWAVAGLVPASTQVFLRTGWNFIGYASFGEQTVGQFLAGIPYQTVEGYANDPPHNLRRLGAADTLSAGNGYWVHVSADAVVTLGN